MSNEDGLFTDEFMGVVWITVHAPSLDNLLEIIKEIKKDSSDLNCRFSGISFGKSDIICEIAGSSPSDILSKVSDLEEILTKIKGIHCFSDITISNELNLKNEEMNEDFRDKENEMKAIVFYIFCKLRKFDHFETFLYRTKKFFNKSGSVQLYFSLGMHLLIKITTEDFIETFINLNKFRSENHAELISIYDFITFDLNMLSEMSLNPHLRYQVTAITGIELNKELPKNTETPLTSLIQESIFPVTGAFDYMSLIQSNSLKSITNQVFEILSSPKIQSTSTILGISPQDHEEVK